MKDRHSVWMAFSGATGFALFLVANLTNIFEGLNVLAGLIQLCANAFVLITWGRACLDRARRGKVLASLFAACGVVVPMIMAGLTIYRVLLPPLLRQLY